MFFVRVLFLRAIRFSIVTILCRLLISTILQLNFQVFSICTFSSVFYEPIKVTFYRYSLWEASLPLKGQCHKIFCFRFFHESPSPKPLKITVGSLRIFSKIRGDIRKSRCTTGVNDSFCRYSQICTFSIVFYEPPCFKATFYRYSLWEASLPLKGQCHKIFFLRFFS